MRARLVVICGLPGSGKTTLAKELEASMPAVRFCPDDWIAALQLDIWDQELRYRLESIQWRLAQDLLALGGNVVIEFGSWAREERDLLRLRARELGCAVELRYLELPFEELWRRVEARSQRPGEAVMTRAHLEEWSTVIQVPDATERALFDTPLP